MVNPTIEEVGHYRPDVGKCQICNEFWGLHSIEEENDHAMKILDWLEKKEIAQKISEDDFMSKLVNPNMVRVLREYFKNIPPIKGTLGAKYYLTLTKEQRRELQKERKKRNDQQAFESAEKFLRDMKRKYGK